MELNEPQKKAVETDSGKVLVIAGPGTGKTRVMVNRVERLISEGVSGHNILMLTFTNKAAREMRERISKLVPPSEARKISIGTFHSIALKVLKDYGELLGYKPGMTIYDSMDQEDIIRVLIKENSFRISANKALELLSKFYSDGYIGENNVPDPAILTEFNSFLSKYKRFLKENNSLDFGMILIETRHLLVEFSYVQEHYENLFTHTMVDEYQDTDRTQYDLHSLINSDNLFCVGDANQAIYGWRGASIEIILGFEDHHPDAEIIVLDQNYRSTTQIVEASNNVISHNKNRFETKQWTDRKGEKVCKKRITAGESQIAETITNLTEHCGYGYKDIAVLSRGHALLEDLCIELHDNSIPCLHVGGNRGIFKDPNIRQFIRLLRVINNPADNFSCRLVINWTEFRFHESTIRKIELECLQNDSYLLEELAKEDIFFQWLLDSRKEFELASVEYIADKLAHKLKFDYEILANYIVDWLTLEEGSGLSDFLNHLSTKSLQDEIKKDVDKVILSTIHAAKGLEWPVVIIVGAEEGKLPITRKTSDIEEERRLMFVAMTRAQNILYVTWRGQYKPKFGRQTKMADESRFVKESCI